ncbi:tRNA (adenosine(37)-N6)-threonylcarbamoyltransferase complex dimerization subunit type 1 TsaB [Paenibacillus glacialis]|uniref:tRNA threonylcarbamoyladenosine biosynthesis protein TsaB n=1 Tax=Paenibacillus glacialis TaxID=494026 RepID=A0A168NZL1_9BACL|nr:tRNA (adenosine(37)-N6)-threonylcarbamoyltransferase complex dimerization subunit type 1 TsaB [Paenibacillus glacialis]OAB46249.1 tRNA threonylcarbamoyladenosine biosynthesis protein TsaB [Paenibacillus glacialis]
MNKPQKLAAVQRVLALDTSTTSLSVAIMENGKVLHEINEFGERNHSIRILSIVEEVLKASSTLNTDVQGIAVGIGPGSYTGTRIAVTAAKTLAWAWNVPVVGISTLHSLAYGGFIHAINAQEDKVGSGQINWIIPLIDARRGQVYTALFSSSESSAPYRLEQDAIRLMETWIEELVHRIEATFEQKKPHSIWFVGDVNLHKETAERLRIRLGDALHIVSYDLEGRYVGVLGTEKFHTGEQDDMHSLVPNYTQLAEAEANLLRKP